MASGTVTWVGRTPGDAVRGHVRKLKRRDAAIMELVTSDVEDAATRIVRRKTGKTADAMGHRVEDHHRGVEGVVFNTHFVSLFLELGTSHQPPYPFMRPAADEVAPGGSLARYFARKLAL